MFFLMEEVFSFFAYPLSFFIVGPLMLIYVLVLIGDSKSSPKYYIPVLILEFVIAAISIAFTVVNAANVIPENPIFPKNAETDTDDEGEGCIGLSKFNITCN